LVVCAIGTTEPLAAAGLGADLITLRALGVRPVYVVTGVSAQNSKQVRAVRALPPAIVRDQLLSIWRQVRPSAVLIGLIPDAPAMRSVRRFLSGLRPRPPTVVDPVFKASTGEPLAARSARSELLGLLPLATIITPNADELSALTGRTVTSIASAASAARLLHARYGCAVLATGGHLAGSNATDVLITDSAEKLFVAKRAPHTMRGMGGILAAALAAALARDEDLLAAVASARRVVGRALRAARPLGSGRLQL